MKSLIAATLMILALASPVAAKTLPPTANWHAVANWQLHHPLIVAQICIGPRTDPVCYPVYPLTSR